MGLARLMAVSDASPMEIRMRKIAAFAGVVSLLAASAWGPATAQTTIHIVAAENFYGDVAQQLAGPDARVTSIMSNPDEDPHLFEASPSVARDLSQATIVIANGADYDPWMEKLLGASKSTSRKTINVADLVHKKAGDNPHLWYDPATMPAFARALTASLSATDPAHKTEYDQRLQSFLDSMKPIQVKVTELHKKYSGAPVTATEPVFGYMAAALGLKMHNERFQLAVMNNTEPAASDVAAFENDLKKHRVKLLIYNSQATDEAAKRLLNIAQESKVPVVGVTETEPSGKTYQEWMLGQLDALDNALSHRES
jgi:zinc/manganese transport system substrate-binding protein